MRTARRFRFDVMAALLAVVTGVLAVCPCLPPPEGTASEHSCCPGDPTLALTADSPDCCADHTLRDTAVATSAIPMPSSLGAVPAMMSPDSDVPAPRFVSIAFVSVPPLVLRI